MTGPRDLKLGFCFCYLIGKQNRKRPLNTKNKQTNKQTQKNKGSWPATFLVGRFNTETKQSLKELWIWEATGEELCGAEDGIYPPGVCLKSQELKENSEDEDGVPAGPFSMVLLVIYIFVCGKGW